MEITAKGQSDIEDLVKRITEDATEVIKATASDLLRRDYRIVHDTRESGDKTVAISWGEYRYEETLSHLITTVLNEKEQKVRKGLAGKPQIKCVAALDARSLLALPLEPESDYERRMAERHQHYFDRLRVFRRHVVGACQAFVAQSPLIRGVLLWERRRLRNADEVHRRYAIRLVTREEVIELRKTNLSANLSKLVAP